MKNRTGKALQRRSRRRASPTTSPFGERLIQAMREAVAFERGELKAKVTRREIPQDALRGRAYSHLYGSRVSRLRERLRLSQPVFAQALNVSPETVKKWEQGTRVPEGAAVRLLELAEEHPEWLITRLQSSNGKSRRRAAVSSVD